MIHEMHKFLINLCYTYFTVFEAQFKYQALGLSVCFMH